MMKRTLLFLGLLFSGIPALAAVPPGDFSSVAERCGQWVVNINTATLVREVYSPFGNDPVFRQYFDLPQEGRTVRRQSLGSGLIISKDGQVLTNAHVVANADEITVTLINGESYAAKLLGADEAVDLAVLQIQPKKPLDAAELGDSDKVKVGQWAIAIGNPLGFDHSVTVGVISAKGRTNVFGGSGAGRYQNFLQSDASINQGNSGGPLCDAQGRVIGINSAIATPNQGSVGLGFAIPINMVKRSIPDLIKRGKVVAPHMGFYSQDLTPALAKALRLKETSGVLVTDVAAGGAAAKAGLQRSDVIVAVDGKGVVTSLGMKSMLYEHQAGEAIRLTVQRKGQQLEVSVVGDDPKAAADSGYWHGLQVQANSPAIAVKLGLATNLGVVVKAVAPKSSADETGLAAGDVLLEINQKPVRSQQDWDRLTETVDEAQDALVRVLRGREMAYVVLRAE
jgi:serine protease Do